MPTIVYCDYITGDDSTGDGSYTTPYKTITQASTGLTGGDEVRVAKSPEPTALTGTIEFTKNSATITGTGTLFATELVIGDFVEGGDGMWMEVITITNDTSATLFHVYSGTTQSGVSSRKLGVTDTGQPATSGTEVQAVSTSGTSTSSLLAISGGWNLSTQEQTGQTYFRQMHSTFSNRWGQAIKVQSRSFISFDKIHCFRYQYGFYFLMSFNNTVISTICNSNTYGISFNMAGKNTVVSAICHSNATGIGISSTSHYNTFGSIICDSNSNTGLYINSNLTKVGSVIARFNANGIYIATAYDSRFSSVTTEGNTSRAILADGVHFINKASIADSTKVVMTAAYSDDKVYINNMGGYSYIYTNYGNIISQDVTAGGTGKEWKLSPTNALRNYAYPLVLSIAKIAVIANSQVTVTCYFKKSGTDIAGALVLRGGQIANENADRIVTCPDNTSRNQVTLQFTPTESGVVEIEAWAWYVSSTSASVIVDDISISQS